MDDKTNDLLLTQIEKEFSSLDHLKGDEKAKAIDGIATLYKLKLDELKIDNESVAEYNRSVVNDAHFKSDDEFRHYQLETEASFRESDKAVKEAQAKDQRFGKLLEIGANVAVSITSIIAYNHWFNKGLKFEETGTICTSWVRNIVNKMLPKK